MQIAAVPLYPLGRMLRSSASPAPPTNRPSPSEPPAPRPQITPPHLPAARARDDDVDLHEPRHAAHHARHERRLQLDAAAGRHADDEQRRVGGERVGLGVGQAAERLARRVEERAARAATACSCSCCRCFAAGVGRIAATILAVGRCRCRCRCRCGCCFRLFGRLRRRLGRVRRRRLLERAPRVQAVERPPRPVRRERRLLRAQRAAVAAEAEHRVRAGGVERLVAPQLPVALHQDGDAARRRDARRERHLQRPVDERALDAEIFRVEARSVVRAILGAGRGDAERQDYCCEAEEREGAHFAGVERAGCPDGF